MSLISVKNKIGSKIYSWEIPTSVLAQEEVSPLSTTIWFLLLKKKTDKTSKKLRHLKSLKTVLTSNPLSNSVSN